MVVENLTTKEGGRAKICKFPYGAWLDKGTAPFQIEDDLWPEGERLAPRDLVVEYQASSENIYQQFLFF